LPDLRSRIRLKQARDPDEIGRDKPAERQSRSRRQSHIFVQRKVYPKIFSVSVTRDRKFPWKIDAPNSRANSSIATQPIIFIV
jgi:hypothetical protein